MPAEALLPALVVKVLPLVPERMVVPALRLAVLTLAIVTKPAVVMRPPVEAAPAAAMVAETAPRATAHSGLPRALSPNLPRRCQADERRQAARSRGLGQAAMERRRSAERSREAAWSGSVAAGWAPPASSQLARRPRAVAKLPQQVSRPRSAAQIRLRVPGRVPEAVDPDSPPG
jgi:hypothetical protein